MSVCRTGKLDVRRPDSTQLDTAEMTYIVYTSSAMSSCGSPQGIILAHELQFFLRKGDVSG